MSGPSDDLIPDGITRDNILHAIGEFDRDGMPGGFKPSHTYDVVHEGRGYPPPAIIALAIKQLTGFLPPPAIRAGRRTKCFAVLEECGFTIVQKKPKGKD
jgi:hypothetical protein